MNPFLAEWKRADLPNDARQRLREDALQRFLSLGLPTTHHEEWKFTSVAPIAERSFALGTLPLTSLPATAVNVAPHLAAPLAVELVFVNGRYAPSLSRVAGLPHGVHVENLATVPDARLARIATFDERPFVALNTAFLGDGAYIEVPAGVVVEQPIHLLFFSDVARAGEVGRALTARQSESMMAHPRVLIICGANSQTSIVETYIGAAGASYLTNAVTEVELGENAHLNHYRLQYEAADAYHVGAIHVRASRSAHYASHAISLGAALARTDVEAVLNGDAAECTLNGLYAADGQRFVDHHTAIDHAQPHCASREVYKGILSDRARGVFNGKVIVRPDAQKTDAKQTNRALLLSADAQINTKPQLEIFANDVKCTHGAAIGQLDDEAIFYLRARGLGEREARRLLVHAFAGDVLQRLPLEAIRVDVERRLGSLLAAA